MRRLVLAAFLLPVLSAPAATPARAAAYGLVPDEAFLRAQVREPLFAFVFTLVEGDSLGTWTGEDVAAFADGWVRPSDFPLERLRSLRRAAVPPAARARRRGAVCTREITVELAAPRVDTPMPYSILGYHPGMLSFGSPLVIREWRLGVHELHVRGEEGSRRATVEGLTVFQVVGGWAVLDVDAWLDRLLGRKLDDAATYGFTTGRAEGRLLGIGSSVGRGGRLIMGELDLRRGTVAPNARPLARALAGTARPFALPEGDDHAAPWAPYLAAGGD